MDSPHLQQAFLAIDLRNSGDPVVIRVRGADRLKEQAHAELATEWVRRLRPGAGEALLLAARAHHVGRWEIPRDTYPTGRLGYLTWRRDLKDHHIAILRGILEREGYDEAVIARAAAILRRERLRDDPEAQTLEDALCLIFLETQLEELAGRLAEAKLLDILKKTLVKMSPEGIAAARRLPMPAGASELLNRVAPA